MTPQEMTEYDPPATVGALGEVLFLFLFTDEQESWWKVEVTQVSLKKGDFFAIDFPDEGEIQTREVVESRDPC